MAKGKLCIQMMNLVSKLMKFVSQLMNFVSKLMNCVSKLMNFVSKLLNFVLQNGGCRQTSDDRDEISGEFRCEHRGSDNGVDTYGIHLSCEGIAGKSDESCIENDESCIINDESCIINDELCIENDQSLNFTEGGAPMSARE